MALTLYFHPFSSYCQKAVIALYENDTPFTPRHINLGDEAEAAELRSLWPMRKFPVLQDDARNQTVAESSIIIEYLAQHYPGKSKLIPSDPDHAREVRFKDRFFDLHIMDHASKAVVDHFRPAGKNDRFGVEASLATVRTAYDVLEKDIAGKTWATGDTFTMADVAAFPALFYADLIVPLADKHKKAAAYLDRLLKRPSVARALKEGAATLMEGFPFHAQYRSRMARIGAELHPSAPTG